MTRYDTEGRMARYVRQFNRYDDECYRQAIPNDKALDWLMEYAPRVALPDAALEEIFYFRLWTLRKHVKQTPYGRVITEFLPDVPWSGAENTIVCAAGHHVSELKWLRDDALPIEYLRFLYERGDPLAYSCWLESAVGELALQKGNTSAGLSLLPRMREVFAAREKALQPSGLYWSEDDRDGAEYSISGNGLRPTLNSYQYANALALARFEALAGEPDRAEMYRRKAEALRERVNVLLWSVDARFYRAIHLARPTDEPAHDPRFVVRELFGYAPWAFGLAPEGRADAFAQLADPEGFAGAFGPRCAERRHPGYGIWLDADALNRWLASRGEPVRDPEGHECLWNGPSWPFATSVALRALANLLLDYADHGAQTADDYLRLLRVYAKGQHIRKDGRTLPWIDEDLDPDTGLWIARDYNQRWAEGAWPPARGGYERGKDYNHSTFIDPVLGGLFGIRATERGVRVAPLFPADWAYAIAERVPIQGSSLTVRYDHESGYNVDVDGVTAFHSERPEACWLPTWTR